MRISRSIFLICISLLLLLPSCYLTQYEKTGKVDMSGPGYDELMPFPSSFEKALYKARLEVNGHEFAGLMMIKAFEEGVYKAAFFSELGLNFFDFELKPVAGKNKLGLYVNNIYEPLDKGFLLNKFEKYFSMILGPGPSDTEEKTYLKKDGSMVLVSVDSYKGNDAYLSRNLIEPYSGIINYGGPWNRDKITITLSQKNNAHCPENILIEQPGFRLKFMLEFVK